MPDLIELSSRIIDSGVRSEPPNRITLELSEVLDRVAVVEAFSHIWAFDTGDGLVLFDASGVQTGARAFASLRRWRTARVHTLVYTHGHVDHVGGSGAILAEAADRGLARPDVVAHEAVRDRLGPLPLHQRVEPGDWAWVPSIRAVVVADLFIWTFPNAGNPQKVQRHAGEWAAALQRMADLRPEYLLPAHGLPVAGEQRVGSVLTATAEALEHLESATVALMNEGATLDTILHTVRVPDHLADLPYLQPLYDEPEFVVRNIYRLYGGWWDGDPASLKPAPRADLATDDPAVHEIRRATCIGPAGPRRPR